MSARRHIPSYPVFAYVREAKELRENGLHQEETKELEQSAERPVSSDKRYPTSGCFADVYQRKGGAGARMRMHLNRKELEEISGRAGKERGAAQKERAPIFNSS
jgi:hypothetical protein